MGRYGFAIRALVSAAMALPYAAVFFWGVQKRKKAAYFASRNSGLACRIGGTPIGRNPQNDHIQADVTMFRALLNALR